MTKALTTSRSRSSSSSATEPLSLAKTVLRRWGLLAFVLGLFLAGGLSALTIWLWEPVYDAKQFVHVIQNREYSEVEERAGNKADPKELLAPIYGDPLLGQLLLNPDIQKRPDIDIKTLRKMVRYESAGGELYAVICRDRSPGYAALVAQELARELVEYQRDYKDNSLQQLENKVIEKIAMTENEIKKISEQLAVKHAQLTGTSGDDKPRDLDGKYLADLRIKNGDDIIERDQMVQEVNLLAKRLESVGDEFDQSFIETSINSSPAVSGIDQQLRELENRRADLSNLDSQHPSVTSLLRRINQLQQDRTATIKRLLELGKQAWIEQQKRDISAQIAEHEQSIARQSHTIKARDQEISRLAAEQANTNRLNFEFEELLKQRDRAYAQLDDGEAELSGIRTREMSLYPIRIWRSQRAEAANAADLKVTPPTEPVEYYPWKLLAGAILGGMALPFVLAAAVEFHWKRISTPEQLKLQLPFELLGEVADLPVRSSRPAVLSSKRVTRQLRLYEESVDNLSAILAVSSDQKPVVFSVTSALSNEGKTTLSLQLAISSARSNFGRTLVIDADLRSPSLHRLLGGTMDQGLGDVLSGDVELMDAIQRTPIENLDLLTAGKIYTNPRRYFSSARWAEVLEETRQHYDQVVVDTPPVLAASESLEISRPCDFTIVCVMRDVSRSHSVKRACDRLVAADVTVMGCAFGGVPQYEYAGRYGSYDYHLS